MLIQQLTTEISFPSSTELMIGAITGTAAGIAVLYWLDHRFSRGKGAKSQNLGLKKRM